MLANTPIELRKFRQFICWRLEDKGGSKPTKVPYCPQTGFMASVTNPNHWGTYDDAIFAFNNGSYSGIGFVLTENDPFTFIDLDKATEPLDIQRQVNIFQKFDSYSEISPSGEGLHIIVNGKIPSGRRRNLVEIYSTERYMTLTGNVFHNKPICDRQSLLDILWAEMGKGSKYIEYDGNVEQKNTDDEILIMAAEAVNGEKFKSFYNGEWKFIYPSQSEADFALIDMIAFYTQNKAQIARIFHASPLGQRDKAKRSDYFAYMIGRAFDRQLPPINLDTLNNEWELMQAKSKIEKLEKKRDIPEKDIPLSHNLTLPKGLIGQLAHYIYSSSYRPVPEIALAAAIAMMAGICGRAYNVSDQGLNLYILLLAKTGRGKETMAAKTSELMGYIRKANEMASNFVGPADFASGQGLTRHLADNPIGSMFSIVGEFGLKMQTLSDPRGASSVITLKKMLLDLFHKSGKNGVFNPVVYSDKEKNTKTIYAPALTILGESTPSSLYDNVNEDNITEGLLPRFLTIEYTGERVPSNKNHAQIKPDPEMLTHLFSVVSTVMTLTQSKQVNDVRLTPDAQIIFDKFEQYCDNNINSSENEAIGELWNRTHIKALRLAALIAVGVNENWPCIDADAAQWAIDFVKRDTERVCYRFEGGKIGKYDSSKQSALMLKVIRDYITLPFEKCAAKYDKSATAEKIYKAKFISLSYLNRRLASAAPFKSDRLGSTHAIKINIQALIDNGAIAEIPKSQVKVLGSSARCFAIMDSSLLEE